METELDAEIAALLAECQAEGLSEIIADKPEDFPPTSDERF